MTVDEIKATHRLLDVIQQHTPVKRVGRDWRALCPFHADTDPSLSINPDKGVYLCRACGAAGDVITWLAWTEGKSIADYLRSQRASEELPPGPRPPSRQEQASADRTARACTFERLAVQLHNLEATQARLGQQFEDCYAWWNRSFELHRRLDRVVADLSEFFRQDGYLTRDDYLACCLDGTANPTPPELIAHYRFRSRGDDDYTHDGEMEWDPCTRPLDSSDPRARRVALCRQAEAGSTLAALALKDHLIKARYLADQPHFTDPLPWPWRSWLDTGPVSGL